MRCSGEERERQAWESCGKCLKAESTWWERKLPHSPTCLLLNYHSPSAPLATHLSLPSCLCCSAGMAPQHCSVIHGPRAASSQLVGCKAKKRPSLTCFSAMSQTATHPFTSLWPNIYCLKAQGPKTGRHRLAGFNPWTFGGHLKTDLVRANGKFRFEGAVWNFLPFGGQMLDCSTLLFILPFPSSPVNYCVKQT